MRRRRLNHLDRSACLLVVVREATGARGSALSRAGALVGGQGLAARTPNLREVLPLPNVKTKCLVRGRTHFICPLCFGWCGGRGGEGKLALSRAEGRLWCLDLRLPMWGNVQVGVRPRPGQEGGREPRRPTLLAPLDSPAPGSPRHPLTQGSSSAAGQ